MPDGQTTNSGYPALLRDGRHLRTCQCRAFFEQMLREEGVLRIRKETGMFTAIKKPGEGSAG